MKKLVLTTLLAVAVSLSTFATDGGKKKSDDTNKVFYSVMRQFETEFSNPKNVTWTVNEQFQKADFKMNGVKMSAYFDATGQYLGYTETVQYHELPVYAKRQIAHEYEGFYLKEVIRFQSANTSSLALARLAGSNSNFDELYFVTLTKEGKQVSLTVTPSSDVQLLSKN